MKEIWMDIPNYKGYQVSNLGRVRTYNKITYTNKHGIRHWKKRILKQKCQIRKNGRKDYRVNLWSNGKPYTLLVARLVAFTFYNQDIKNQELTVNHKNGDSTNNNLNNLEIISLSDNIRHSFRTNIHTCQIKVKIEDKITGTIIYPSSLIEGSKIIGHNQGYLSAKIIKNIFENEKYKWEVL